MVLRSTKVELIRLTLDTVQWRAFVINQWVLQNLITLLISSTNISYSTRSVLYEIRHLSTYLHVY
jgi:hypothetical protein